MDLLALGASASVLITIMTVALAFHSGAAVRARVKNRLEAVLSGTASVVEGDTGGPRRGTPTVAAIVGSVGSGAWLGGVGAEGGHAQPGADGAEAKPGYPAFRIIKRGVVFKKRTSPAYRIDFFGPRPDGVVLRGALLISLGGGNVVWAVIQAEAEDWKEIAPDIDDIFLRISVRR